MCVCVCCLRALFPVQNRSDPRIFSGLPLQAVSRLMLKSGARLHDNDSMLLVDSDVKVGAVVDVVECPSDFPP